MAVLTHGERTVSCSSIASGGEFVGYGGPCPPATGQIHHYIFTLYALTVAQLPGQALTYDQVIQEISEQVAGATVTIGTFVRR